MNGDDEFSIRVEQGAQGSTIHLVGDLDIASAPEMRRHLLDLANERITLDFSAVTFMDSTAIGVLIAAHTRIAENGGTMTLRGVRPAQMKVLQVTGVDELLHFDDDAPRG